jgi:hypothetical protein
MIAAKNDCLTTKEINWKPTYNGETWDNYLNGWLPPEGIQVIANYIKQIIILIYLDSSVMQMFFPIDNNNNTFFIKEEELESLSFKEVVQKRGYNIEVFKRTFHNDSINFDLSMIDFLQKLFEFKAVIGMLSSGYERGHFQAFQPKTIISSSKSNENIDKNINDDEYGFSPNINIEEEKEELNNNKIKEETKEEEKEKPPLNSSTFFETHTSNQQNESEKNVEEQIPKYNDFSYKEKECFKILVKNSQNDIGNFFITKKMLFMLLINQLQMLILVILILEKMKYQLELLKENQF